MPLIINSELKRTGKGPKRLRKGPKSPIAIVKARDTPYMIAAKMKIRERGRLSI